MREVDGPTPYELIMGERRWRATQKAGLDTIPAIVRQTPDQDLLRDTRTGEASTLDVTGLFVAIGQDPRTDLVQGQVELTEHGTIRIDHPSSRTSQPGVFAAGDVTDHTYRQAITAAGSGCVAAQDVEHYLATVADVEEAAPAGPDSDANPA